MANSFIYPKNNPSDVLEFQYHPDKHTEKFRLLGGDSDHPTRGRSVSQLTGRASPTFTFSTMWDSLDPFASDTFDRSVRADAARIVGAVDSALQWLGLDSGPTASELLDDLDGEFDAEDAALAGLPRAGGPAGRAYSWVVRNIGPRGRVDPDTAPIFVLKLIGQPMQVRVTDVDVDHEFITRPTGGTKAPARVLRFKANFSGTQFFDSIVDTRLFNVVRKVRRRKPPKATGKGKGGTPTNLWQDSVFGQQNAAEQGARRAVARLAQARSLEIQLRAVDAGMSIIPQSIDYGQAAVQDRIRALRESAAREVTAGDISPVGGPVASGGNVGTPTVSATADVVTVTSIAKDVQGSAEALEPLRTGAIRTFDPNQPLFPGETTELKGLANDIRTIVSGPIATETAQNPPASSESQVSSSGSTVGATSFPHDDGTMSTPEEFHGPVPSSISTADEIAQNPPAPPETLTSQPVAPEQAAATAVLDEDLRLAALQAQERSLLQEHADKEWETAKVEAGAVLQEGPRLAALQAQERSLLQGHADKEWETAKIEAGAALQEDRLSRAEALDTRAPIQPSVSPTEHTFFTASDVASAPPSASIVFTPADVAAADDPARASIQFTSEDAAQPDAAPAGARILFTQEDASQPAPAAPGPVVVFSQEEGTADAVEAALAEDQRIQAAYAADLDERQVDEQIERGLQEVVPASAPSPEQAAAPPRPEVLFSRDPSDGPAPAAVETAQYPEDPQEAEGSGGFSPAALAPVQTQGLRDVSIPAEYYTRVLDSAFGYTEPLGPLLDTVHALVDPKYAAETAFPPGTQVTPPGAGDANDPFPPNPDTALDPVTESTIRLLNESEDLGSDDGDLPPPITPVSLRDDT